MWDNHARLPSITTSLDQLHIRIHVHILRLSELDDSESNPFQRRLWIFLAVMDRVWTSQVS
jgi:hypothetical protein